MLGRALVLALLVPALAGAATAPQITRDGVGEVTLGATYAKLHRAGLVGRLGHPCALEGPTGRSARLRGSVEGRVDFRHGHPHRARNIEITGGSATANGAGIGATIKAIRRAYPDAFVDHSTDDVRGFTLVTANRPSDGGSTIAFAVDTGTHRTTVIGIPYLQSCD